MSARRSLAHGGLALAAGVLAACSRTKAPAEPPLRSGEPQATQSSAPARGAIESASVAGAPALVLDGCALGFDARGTPEERLESLRRLCAPDMAPLLPQPRRIPVTASAMETKFNVTDASGCVRVLLVGSRDARLELELYDAGGRPYGRDSGRSFALLGARGPLCLRNPGSYRVRVAGAGAGVAALQVYHVE